VQRTSSVKSDALSVLVDGLRLKGDRGRRIHPVVVLLPPLGRLRRKVPDRWNGRDLIRRCYRREPRHVLTLQRPTARPHITTRPATISIAPDPAICVSKTPSTYVSICARSAVVPTAIRARHYVLLPRTQIEFCVRSLIYELWIGWRRKNSSIVAAASSGCVMWRVWSASGIVSSLALGTAAWNMSVTGRRPTAVREPTRWSTG
jgi:hypothetical protein